MLPKEDSTSIQGFFCYKPRTLGGIPRKVTYSEKSRHAKWGLDRKIMYRTKRLNESCPYRTTDPLIVKACILVLSYQRILPESILRFKEARHFLQKMAPRPKNVLNTQGLASTTRNSTTPRSELQTREPLIRQQRDHKTTPEPKTSRILGDWCRKLKPHDLRVGNSKIVSPR